MKTISIVILSGLFLTVLFSFQDDVLNGWRKNDKSKSYEIKIENGKGMDGKNCATIKSVKRKIDGYGALSQRIKADKFLNKKILLSGFLKTSNVKGSAHFWMRVDGAAKSVEPLSSDAMYNRPVKGDSDWKKYEIVLNVPDSAKIITYGAMLRGTGQIWFDNMNIDIAPDSLPSTDLSDHPENLDFEH